jgi:antitoxin ParD1/3/4
MATMNISLTDGMKAFVEAEAARKGFDTVSEYMRSVIRETQERVARHTHIDSLLLEGLDSGPATPFTDSDWESIQQTLEERHAARQETTHGPRPTKGR